MVATRNKSVGSSLLYSVKKKEEEEEERKQQQKQLPAFLPNMFCRTYKCIWMWYVLWKVIKYCYFFNMPIS